MLATSYQDRLIKLGNEAVEHIERYQSENGYLPDSLEQTGLVVPPDFPVYYQKSDSVHYSVWFGTTLGESHLLPRLQTLGKAYPAI